VNISFRTTTLERGVHTGTVTLADPNALDAPQTITVVVQVGGGVPDQADLFAAPNKSSAEVRFTTGTRVDTEAATTSGGEWLGVALGLDGAGSFRFAFNYRIIATHQDGMEPGVYEGAVVTSNGGLQADNKRVPVRLTITPNPIAFAPELGFEPLRFRLPPGVSFAKNVHIGNRGLGTLNALGATATGPGLSAALADTPNAIRVEVNTAGLAEGSYRGQVIAQSNAENSAFAIPVVVEVIGAGPPVLFAGGATSAAHRAKFDSLAPGSVVALQGEQLLDAASVRTADALWPTSLDDLQVLLGDRPLPLGRASYDEILLQIPLDAPLGESTIRVVRGGVTSNRIAVEIDSAAPRIRLWPVGGNWAMALNADGTAPLPTRVRVASVQNRAARIGDTITLQAYGLGAGNPAGIPVNVTFGSTTFLGGTVAQASSVRLVPNQVGLYEIQVAIPEGTVTGDAVPVILEVNGARGNVATLAIQ
jgi:uncharacterized protein (TIGR03437 family)